MGMMNGEIQSSSDQIHIPNMLFDLLYRNPKSFEGVRSSLLGDIYPNNQSVSGNILTVFTGNHFRNLNETDIIIKTNSLRWTNISHINETCITAISPAGVGRNYPISLDMNGISYVTTTVLFSYRRPNITNVISPPLKGGTIRIIGTDFSKNLNNIRAITIFEKNGCASSECTNPELLLNGDIIAFAGRDLSNKENIAKYINSPETPIYNKS